MSSVQPSTVTTDYLIVGGGLTGTVIASRLAEHLPSSKVTLVEAGTDQQVNPIILSPQQAHALRESDYVWKDSSVEQSQLNHRRIPAVTGKTLSGSSAINAGCWTRCSATDYDQWASIVGEGGERWSYSGQLPHFKRSETWYDPNADTAKHGFEGPVKVHAASESRTYPLRNHVRSAFVNAGLGLKVNEDAQGGDPTGLSSWTENWHEGKRQPSGSVYGLRGVQVLTGCLASKILLDTTVGQESLTARGVKLLDGRSILANKEVIVCCGIGPKKQLKDIGVDLVLEDELVGQTLHDQISLSLFYKLKDGPAKGLALGSPQFNKPEYALGSPVDWMAISIINSDVVKKGLQSDGDDMNDHPLLSPSRPHTEMVVVYAPVGIGLPGLQPPMDGSTITAAVLNLLPTSQGEIKLTSSSATVSPEINPNYYATTTDREILRAGVRNLLQVLDSFEDGVLDCELVIEPFGALTLESTDEEIDERVRASSSTWYHFGGTAAMGKVVNPELRVKGVKGLRVADTSVLPCPLGGHYQAAIFALGEQAAEMIAEET
ncbi:MAG: hypothetical protein Q9160_006064 [Pyrenula sp. 1 TL-2023]